MTLLPSSTSHQAGNYNQFLFSILSPECFSLAAKKFGKCIEVHRQCSIRNKIREISCDCWTGLLVSEGTQAAEDEYTCVVCNFLFQQTN